MTSGSFGLFEASAAFTPSILQVLTCLCRGLSVPQLGNRVSYKNSIGSGQIIATSHDLTPNGRVVGEPCLQWPYFREIQVGEIL